MYADIYHDSCKIVHKNQPIDFNLTKNQLNHLLSSYGVSIEESRTMHPILCLEVVYSM